MLYISLSICYYFINLFKVCLGSRYLACFNHIRRVALTVYIYYCSLLRATLLRVGRRGGSSSRFSPSKTSTVVFYPLLFNFTRCISTPCMFVFYGLSSVSDLDIHLRDPLLGVFSMLNVSNVIIGGSKVVRYYSVYFLSLENSVPAAEVFFPPDLLGILRSCLWVYLFLHSCLAGFFGLLIIPKRFPFFSGLQNSWRD